MKQKKQSKDWYIAATLWLTAGFAIPLIAMLVLGIPAQMVIGENNPILFTTVISIIWVFSIYLGTIYAAKYVNKTYIIKNSDNIAKIAAIYLVVLGGGFRLFNLIKGFHIALMIDSVFFIIGIAVFYTLSKKYIKNSEEVAAIQQ